MLIRFHFITKIFKDIILITFKKIEMFNNQILNELGLTKKYEFIKDLKTVSFETTILLKNKKNKKEVVCKVKQKNKNGSLLSEIWSISQMTNVNIAKVHFIMLNHESLFFYVIEKLQGPTLQEFVSQNDKIDEVVVREYFKQIVSGVNYLHTKNIVNRYVKTNSFMLNLDQTQVKLVEFSGCIQVDYDGLVKSYNKANNYSSPQVFDNPDSFNGFKAEVWAIGVVLYYMMTNSYPFKYKDFKNKNSCNLKLHERFSNHLCELFLEVFKPSEKHRLSVFEVSKLKWINEKTEVNAANQLDLKCSSVKQSFTSTNSNKTLWKRLSWSSDTSAQSSNYRKNSNSKKELVISFKRPEHVTDFTVIQKSKAVISRNGFMVKQADNYLALKGMLLKDLTEISMEFIFLPYQETKIVFRLLTIETELFDKIVSNFLRELLQDLQNYT